MVWQANLAQTEHVLWNGSQDHAIVALGLHDADTETGAVKEGETEISPSTGFQLFLHGIGSDGLHEDLGMTWSQGRTFHRNHGSADAQSRGLMHLKVKVTGFLVDHELQQIVHFVRAIDYFFYCCFHIHNAIILPDNGLMNRWDRDLDGF